MTSRWVYEELSRASDKKVRLSLVRIAFQEERNESGKYIELEVSEKQLSR